MMRVPETITCVECGGDAFLISFLPPEGEVEEGTPLAYRCRDCQERFDVVMAVEAGEDEEPT